jgi:5'-3' exonuclease
MANLEEINDKSRKHLILIDSSYFIFYRFHATRKQYSLAYPDEYATYPDNYNWLNDKVFMTNFEKCFIKQINSLRNNLQIPDCENITYIWTQDCSNKDIWRHQYIENYKGTRQESLIKQKFHSYEIFNFVYEKIIKDRTLEPNANHFLIQVPNCEADDIVAQTAIHFNKDFDRVCIIGSDTDYLQLCNDKIGLYDINGKKKLCELLGERYLLAKIICGDTSDNIKSCKLFRCSMKSIGGHFENPDKMKLITPILAKIQQKELEHNSILNNDNHNPKLDFTSLNDFEIQFYKNTKVIDFKCIPIYHKKQILDSIAPIFTPK